MLQPEKVSGEAAEEVAHARAINSDMLLAFDHQIGRVRAKVDRVSTTSLGFSANVANQEACKL